MKKTYIIPETTVVALNVRDNVLQALSAPDAYTLADPADPASPTVETGDVGAREIISSRDAWEEW